jgi:hypothetical protein
MGMKDFALKLYHNRLANAVPRIAGQPGIRVLPDFTPPFVWPSSPNGGNTDLETASISRCAPVTICR